MLRQLTERCFYLPYEKTGDRPSLGFVRSDRLCLQIDAGNSPAHYRRMSDALAAAGLPAPNLIAFTHAHWDHTYGACAADCPVIASEATQAELRRMVGWTWTAEAMAQRVESGEDIAFCTDAIAVEYAELSQVRVRTADLVYAERLTVDLGGVSAVIARTTNSHAADCSLIYIPEERVVYLGDICYEDLHHKPPCCHRSRLNALRDALSALPFEWGVPGHQLPLSRQEVFDELNALEHGDLLQLP